jgi:hypothetical protein
MNPVAHLAEMVYLLCAVTSIVCAALLARGYRRSRARILLWSTLTFVFLALNNSLLFVDMVIFPGPQNDLSPLRDITALLAGAILVYGLIWDAD